MPVADPSLPTINRLGEELPIFCEKCGYSLHGLPQSRCAQCEILQFHCPECGHHQPINTLRPAFLRVLARSRAAVLAIWVLVKLNLLFWPLAGWFGLGNALAYSFESAPANLNGTFSYSLLPMQLNWEMALGLGIFALVYGCAARMLLLRWRRGILVGLVLVVLVDAAFFLGAWTRESSLIERDRIVPSFFGPDFIIALLYIAGVLLVATVGVWIAWVGLIRLFLPRRIGDALLAWQSSLSTPATSPDLATLWK